jgi:ankyrin repeat protein
VSSLFPFNGIEDLRPLVGADALKHLSSLVGANGSDRGSVLSCVEQDGPINGRTLHGERVLHLAVESRDLELVKYFLDRDSAINESNNEGWTPLRQAINQSISFT